MRAISASEEPPPMPAMLCAGGGEGLDPRLVQCRFGMLDGKVRAVDLVGALADERVEDPAGRADVPERDAYLIGGAVADDLWCGVRRLLAIFGGEAERARLDVAVGDAGALQRGADGAHLPRVRRHRGRSGWGAGDHAGADPGDVGDAAHLAGGRA